MPPRMFSVEGTMGLRSWRYADGTAILRAVVAANSSIADGVSRALNPRRTRVNPYPAAATASAIRISETAFQGFMSTSFCAEPARLTTNNFLTLLQRRQTRHAVDVPATAEGFDKQHARVHTPALDIDLETLVRQRGCLRSDDLKIVVDATLISVGKELQRFLGRGNGVALLLFFVFQNPQRSQIIFHLLKRSQRGLPISRYRGIVTGNRNIGAGAAAARVKQSFRQRGSHCPKAAWPVQPVENRSAPEPAGRAQRHGGKECGARDSDLLVRFLDSSFSGGYIGPAFEQL